jgi:cold shock CspA family protein
LRRSGAVTRFDPLVGIGFVSDGDGHEHRFHCTQIADGTRDIPTAVAVSYALVAGRGGVWEAADIRRT